MTFRLTTAAIAATILAVAPAHAAEFRKFDRAAFAAAQAQGRPVIIDVHAWWCPVCFSQNHTIRQTVASPAYDKMVIFRIDYDTQKPVWQSFGVRKQATLIAFHGRREVGRLAYMTNKDAIDALLASAVR
ncbi:thioredoxin family protein [Sphingomonas sp. PAMC 26605]|uniref:thioredoxin family protein n=1 Tax=Sphingomonas sp. PAMC 26605 TaxID=1112214 RepID=UPI00026CCAEE|nr:thioredoxin family protein [Sphingomonas sp. PAMC 26605]